MKKGYLIALIITGFLVVPTFTALYGFSNSYNFPLAMPNQVSFQLSSLTSFQQNNSISPQDPSLSNLSSRIAIDSNRIIHLVYVNSSNGNDIIYSNSSNYAIGRQVSHNPNSDLSPAIAVNYASTNTIVYIVWQYNGFNISISNSSDYFSTNLTISNEFSINNTNPDIAIDKNGIIHVVWAASNLTTNFEIWYTNSSTNYQNITVISNNLGNNNTNPRIAIDSNDTVHVAWVGMIGSESEIYYSNSTNNFNTNITVSNNLGGNDSSPDIVVTNQVFIIWSAKIGTNYKIILANSTNNWQNQSISDNSNNNSYPIITKGPGGLIHIIWSVNTGTQNDLIYTDGTENFQTNTTITYNHTNAPGDIAIDNNGKVHIIWLFGNQTFYSNSTYPPPILIQSLIIPMDISYSESPIIVIGKFSDEFYIEQAEIMWSTNTGVSWNTFLMFGPSSAKQWEGWSAIPSYQYGVFLLFKFRITDRTGLSFETTQQIFYYPDTRSESVVLIIILFGVLGTLTALYLIPQTREFFGRLFGRKKSIPITESKKSDTERKSESQKFKKNDVESKSES